MSLADEGKLLLLAPPPPMLQAAPARNCCLCIPPTSALLYLEDSIPTSLSLQQSHWHCPFLNSTPSRERAHRGGEGGGVTRPELAIGAKFCAVAKCSSKETTTATARGRWRLSKALGSCDDFPEAGAVDAAVSADDDDAADNDTQSRC